MNTVGKILVLLNLVFALLTAGFLVIDYAARTNWRERAEHNQRVVDVAVAQSTALQQTVKNLMEEKKQREKALESSIISANSTEGQLQNQIKKLAQQVRELTDVAKTEGLNREKAVAEAARLQKEVAFLADVIKKREKEILDTQAEVADVRNKYLQKEAEAKVATERANGLVVRIQEMEKKYADLLTRDLRGGGGSPSAMVRDASYENPPPAFVKGRIEKLTSGDGTLVQISIGSDVGVNKDHTLEVYRLKPRPEYLGRLRIVDSYPHRALGRLLPSLAGRALPLQEGDEVASKIQ
jgi:hypothetical protein